MKAPLNTEIQPMEKCNRFILFFLVGLVLVSLAACVSTKNLQKARDAYQNGQLEQAYQYYTELAQQNPSNKDVRQGLEQTERALVDQAVQRSEAILAGSGVKTPTIYNKALSTLNKARQYDPAGEVIPSKIQAISSQLEELERANRRKKQQFAANIQAEEFDAARNALNSLLQTAPNDPELHHMESIWNTAFANSLEERIRESLGRGRLSESKALFQQYKALTLPAERRDRFADWFEQESIAVMQTKIDRLIAGEKYYLAYDTIQGSPYAPNLATRINRIRREGAAHYLALANAHLENGNISRAYLEAVKGLELDGDNPGLFALHRDTRDQILEQLQEYIAIPAFGAPESDPDLGPQFSDALISYLFRILPYGINIVERQKVDLLVKEENLGAREAANRLRADLFISGNVSLLKIDRQESSNKVRVRVKVGEEKQLNPAYEAWLRLPADQQGRTDPPPQNISRDRFETVTYTKGKTTVKGFGSVSLRIFNTRKGAVTYAQEFNANYSTVDTFQDGVAYAGIEGDPLELPTDTEIREKLRNRIIEQIADVVKEKFHKREANFLQTAHYHLSRQEPRKGLDNLAYGFLYCIKAQIPNDNGDFQKTVQTILQLTEGRP